MSLTEPVAYPREAATRLGEPVIEARALERSFGSLKALDGVSLTVGRGEIHALLGPNGAGKSTLLRILTGLLTADAGEVRLAGAVIKGTLPRAQKSLIGLVPSGDRSFYLRVSGFENLLFFGRLHGLDRRTARRRALALLDDVGLGDADYPVGKYSHGMQKRLAVARALLVDPPLVFVDEATHDLDPEGATRVQELIRAAVRRGAAVVWTTQRVEEIRGFSHNVTLLDHGTVRFNGTVAQLMAQWRATTYLLHVAGEGDLLATARACLGNRARVEGATDRDPGHLVLGLGDELVLGDAITALTRAGIQVLSCTEETSSIQGAFLHLVRGSGR